MENLYFGSKYDDKPALKRPDSCEECVHKNNCRSWEKCPVLKLAQNNSTSKK